MAEKLNINIEYNSREIVQVVLENLLKMLERRKLINSWKDELKTINDFTKTTFDIKLKDKNMLSIYHLTTKLSSIVQGTPLNDFLSNNIDIPKIVVCREPQKKVLSQIIKDFKNVEFFIETEMLEDLPSKVFIPEHQLLNADEKKELLTKFLEHDLAKIFSTDVMARYYGGKVGDIFRIVRPSITSGKNIIYRRVINGPIDILFEK